MGKLEYRCELAPLLRTTTTFKSTIFAECIKQVERIVGRPIETVELDICNKESMNHVFKTNKFHAVLHLAAFKAVGESVLRPLDYYKTNVLGTINVLEVRLYQTSKTSDIPPNQMFKHSFFKCMKEHNVKNFVFSSSATVYGIPQYLPIDEKHPTIGDQITNPYGKTKYVVEHILKDLYQSDKV